MKTRLFRIILSCTLCLLAAGLPSDNATTCPAAGCSCQIGECSCDHKFNLQDPCPECTVSPQGDIPEENTPQS